MHHRFHAGFIGSVALCCILNLSPLTAGAQNLFVNGDFSAGNTGFTTGYNVIVSGPSASPGTFRSPK